MPDHVAMLLDMLAKNPFLMEHYEDLRQYQMAAVMGTLSQDKARLLAYEVQAILEDERDYPNRLHRPPTEEQLHQQGAPDITVGHLVQDETIRVGLRLRGYVPHILATGATGTGKTTLFRVMMDRVEALNAQKEATK